MGKKEDKDFSLVQQCLLGSETAWREFYSRFVNLIRMVVRRKAPVLSSADLEDIVQCVFLELTTALSNYPKDNSLSGFVCMISERVTIDQHRKNTAVKRSGETESIDHHDGSDEDTTTVASDKPLPDSQMEQAELASRLNVSLQRMDEKCRNLLEMRYLNELSFNEISRETGIAENTLMVQARRCLERLRSTYLNLE